MYVRDAKNREEVWLLDHIEELGLDGTAFRSRDYVVAVDEVDNEKAGFGRIRVHKEGGEAVACELTSIGVLPAWREQGVAAHVIERLVDHAGDQEFSTVYSLTDRPDYLAQFGFEPVEPEALPDVLRERLDAKREGVAPGAIPVVLDVADFEVPDRLRERFKRAQASEPDAEPEEAAEDFGIDSETATYKYDTGR
ncbi:MAG: GNAT family N-acetyltransferase [Halobacteriales archaeon]